MNNPENSRKASLPPKASLNQQKTNNPEEAGAASQEILEVYPGLRARSGAAILDMFIIFFLTIGLERGYAGDYISTFEFNFLYLACTLCYLLFFYLALSSTAGKIILGMHIHKETGGRMSVLQCFIRLALLPLSTGIFLLGYLYLTTNVKRQSLHDKLAHTLVIYIYE